MIMSKSEDFVSRLAAEISALRSIWYELSNVHDKPKADKWSKVEILGHLCDSARYQLLRLEGISASKGIYNAPVYDQNHLVSLMQYQSMTSDAILHLWLGLNHQIMHIWSSCSDDLWLKPTIFGRETVPFFVVIEDYISHLGHHKAQILDSSKLIKPREIISLISAVQTLTSYQAGGGTNEFIVLSKIGDLEIEYYKPYPIDKQKPHLKDELYVIVSGNGFIMKAGQRFPFSPQDVIYVKAGEDHRFVDFTDDFATWVVFYGPKH
jgi:hypothetical protein